MTLTLDATVGGSASNSYLTLSEADAILSARINASAWFSFTQDARLQALVHATRLLDNYISWKGTIASTTQSLRWPRYMVLDRDGNSIDSDVIPQAVKWATAELALQLKQEDREAATDPEGIAQLSVGPISLTFDSYDKPPVISDTVYGMIAFLGTRIRYDGGGTAVMKLART